MKKLLFLFLILIPFRIFASTIIMDADSNRILYKENIDEKRSVASISKIMTAIIVIENGNLDKKVKVGNEIKNINGSSIYLKENDEITIKDLLYGLLLRSGNDAAVVLATSVSGSEKEFVSIMNEKAKQLHMSNTIFNNSHGLDINGGNISTARDMAKLTKYANKNKIYKRITKTKKYKIKINDKPEEIYNKNTLLNSYKYCTGGKTGYTPESGKTFISTAKKNNLNLIIVSMDVPNRFSYHKNLYEKMFKKYKKYKILDKYTFMPKSKFKGYTLYIKNDVYLPLTEKEKDNLKLKIILKDKRQKKLQGKAKIVYNKKVLKKVNVYIKRNKR